MAIMGLTRDRKVQRWLEAHLWLGCCFFMSAGNENQGMILGRRSLVF